MKRIVFLIFAICCFSCKNVYNELIPNNEQSIVSFGLSSEDYQTRSISTDIKHDYITVKVPTGTDVTRLLVQAKVSKQATLFPLTLRYLQEAFPATDVVQLALRMNINPAAKSLDKWFLDLYLENPEFKIPPLVFPINFFSPVQFAVIGGQGGVEIYTVKVLYEDGSDPAIPPPQEPQESEKKILTFNVPLYQKGESRITEDAVKFFLKPGADVRVLVPQVAVSENCVALPLTREYLSAIADKLGLDALTVAQGFITATDKEAFLRATLAPCDTSNLTLELDKPIDFTEPVQFVVLHRGDKTVKLYTITCLTDGGMPHLENIGISKFQNPQVMKDAIGAIDQERKTIECTVYYPVEWVSTHPEAFKLNIDAGYSGDSVSFEYNGATYAEYDAVQFRPIEIKIEQHYLGEAVLKVAVLQDSQKVTYTMKVTFKEDPDTIRNITDFRFEKFYNDKIKSTAVASIVNRDDEGEIKVTVLYMGDEVPYKLKPSFITGGGATVSVAGIPQISRQSEQNFSTELQYLCVSRDKHYKRTYTVSVKFEKVETPEALMKSFSFGMHLNTGLAGDAIGTIDNATNTITVKVTHTTPVVPEELVPEFTSTGLVSVGGIMQTSGSSKHLFRYAVYYKVTALDAPTVTRTYKVNVTFNYATESRCQLLRFYFTKEDNPSLREDVECYISSARNNVFGLLPNGSDITVLKPRFEAYGKVKVAGAEQTSGVNSQDFSNIVDYVVESEDGQYSKTYKVKLQVAGEIIYLSSKAHGRNNGTSWEDAFTTLEDAIDAANEVGASPEIWVADDGFNNQTIRINKAITLRGGFNGTETSKDEREREDGKLKRWLNLVNMTIEGLDDKKISGALVFDGISLNRDDSNNSSSHGFLYFEWEEDDESDPCNSLTFADCIVRDSLIAIEPEKMKKEIVISASDFDAKSRLTFKGSEAQKAFTQRLEIGTTDFFGRIECNAHNVNIVDSNMLDGKLKCTDFSFKKENKEAHCKNMVIDIVSHSGSEKKVKFDGVNIDEVTISRIKESEEVSYEGEVEFQNVNADKITLLGFWAFCKFENSIMKKVNNFSNTIYETKNLEILNCGKKDDKLCGDFVLRAYEATIKDSFFEGNVDLRFFQTHLREIHTTVENMEAYVFHCGGQGIELSGKHKISKSTFSVLNCYAGDEIDIDDVSLSKTCAVSLSNLEIPNSKIKLKKFGTEQEGKGRLRCDTNNLIVGEAGQAKSGIEGFSRVELYGKNSVNVWQSDFDSVGNSDDKGIFVCGNEVTFKENTLHKKHLCISCGSAFNIDEDVRSLSFYYPKAYTFVNRKFSYLCLMGKPFTGCPFELPEVSNENFYVNNCTFNRFVNGREHVILSNPTFIGYGTFLVAHSYPLMVKGMKKTFVEKITVENLKEDEKAEIFLIDSDITSSSGRDYVIHVGHDASLRMKNTKFSQVDRLISAGSKAKVEILSNCVFQSIGVLINGGNASLKIKNETTYPTNDPKFLIDGKIWNIYDSASSPFYIDVASLEMEGATFEKQYEFAIHTKLGKFISTGSAKITDSNFINIGDMCTTCFEGRRECEFENCNFVNAGIVYLATKEPLVKITDGKFENTELHLDMYKTDDSRIILKDVDLFYPNTNFMLTNRFMSPDGSAVDHGPIAVKFEYDLDSLPQEIKTRLGATTVTPEIVKKFIKTKLFKTTAKEKVGYFLNLGNDAPSNSSPKKFYGEYY